MPNDSHAALAAEIARLRQVQAELVAACHRLIGFGSASPGFATAWDQAVAKGEAAITLAQES
jgi:hypothetical protein